jgi:hypothetical protein
MTAPRFALTLRTPEEFHITDTETGLVYPFAGDGASTEVVQPLEVLELANVRPATFLRSFVPLEEEE